MNKFVDIQSLINVALGLQELREKVVFVGGAVINLYNEDVKSFLKKEILFLKNHKNANEILSMHIHPLIVKERFELLMTKINLITE